jgi:hypothetical protein
MTNSLTKGERPGPELEWRKGETHGSEFRKEWSQKSVEDVLVFENV